MFYDNHVHTHFSPDSQEKMQNYIDKAIAIGLNGLCFTDHLDLDSPLEMGGDKWTFDIAQMTREVDKLDKKGLSVGRGIEMGVRLCDGIIPRTEEIVRKHELDFIIASVHFLDGFDPYFPAFFDNKSRAQGFARYLEVILECLKQTDYYCAVGHIDYPVKGCPYPRKSMQYTDAPDLIDALFRHIIERGKCIEINTSVLARLGEEAPDLRIYKRYRELGGEFLSFGSDSHRTATLGQHFAQAGALAKAAGIKYAVSFEKLQPIMHPL